MVQYNDTASKMPAPPRLTERYWDRDLSWLKFNERVLNQVGRPDKTVFEWLSFLHMSASNLDEFFMVRVGRLCNHIHNERARSRKSNVRRLSLLLDELLKIASTSFQKHHDYFLKKVKPLYEANHFAFVQDVTTLVPQEQNQLQHYFQETIYPMLELTVLDNPYVLSTLVSQDLVLGVITHNPVAKEHSKQLTFIQLPPKLPRFYQFNRGRTIFWVPMEEIVRAYLHMLFDNVAIYSVTLFRVIRDGDLSFEENHDTKIPLTRELESKLIEKDQSKIVRLDIEEKHDPWLLNLLQYKWDVHPNSVFLVPRPSLMDLTGLQQLVQQSYDDSPSPASPISFPTQHNGNLFEVLKKQDILLHHPYNSIDLVINFLEKAAEDPYVLAIKMTIYRLAQNSAVTTALRKAAAHGKHVLVLIEIKARFDEAYNMREAKKLEQAGCLVIYGERSVKTHAKMMMIVRREGDHTVRYVHLSSGNYNEDTAKSYADISLMTTDTAYTKDVAEFFDFIIGHSTPQAYKKLITAPFSIRDKLTGMIRQEAKNAQQGLPCGIVIKVNALEDKAIIEELYKASQAGVPIRLIIRGICCLIPQKRGLSATIKVRSIVGNFLEHARIFYFHNQGHAKVYAGSADIMVRSFDKRIESLFFIENPILKQQVINILVYNLRDNVNSYLMQESGAYVQVTPGNEAPFDIHEAFFKLTPDTVMNAQLFA